MKSDPFALNCLLGLSNEDCNDSDEGSESSSGDEIDRNQHPNQINGEIQSSKGETLVGNTIENGSRSVEANYQESDYNLNEVAATKLLGAKLGENLDRFDNLIRDSIVKKGLQEGNK